MLMANPVAFDGSAVSELKKMMEKTVLQMSLHQNITSDIMTMKTK